MITPKDLQNAYTDFTNAHYGTPPTSLKINPATWDFLTKPDPAAVNPQPQPNNWMGVPVNLDPTYPKDQFLFS